MSLTIALLAAQLSTVSFQRPVEPLRDLIPELAKATNQKLSVAPELEWQLVYVRAKDVPPADLMAKIARAVYGRWVRYSESSLVLETDKSRLAADRALHLKDRIANLKRAFKEEREDFKKPPEEGEFEDPARPIFVDMLESLGAENLARHPEGTRIVFSTRPTAAQLPFPNFNPAWESGLREIENRTRARVANRANLPKSAETLRLEKMLDPAYIEARKPRDKGIFSTEIITSPLGKVDFVLEVESDGIVGTVSAYDATGLQQVFEGGSVYISPSPPEAEIKAKTESATPIRLSPATKLVTDFWSYEDVEAKVRAEILGPTHPDPFMRAYREFADSYAKESAENLVLAISDQENRARAGETTRAALGEWMLNSMRPHWGPPEAEKMRRWEVGDGWRIAALQGPCQSYDRDLVLAGARRLTRSAIASLEDRAWIAANILHRYPEYQFELPDWIFTICGVDSDVFDSQLLRVYGLLTESQRTRLRNGEAITAGSMPPAARGILSKICRGEVHAIGPIKAYSEPVARDYISGVQETRNFRFTSLDEPTNSLPSGLPDDALLTMQTDVRTAYVDPEGADWIGQRDGMALPDFVKHYVDLMVDPEEPVKDREVIQTQHERSVLTFMAAPGIGTRATFRIRKPGPEDRKLKLTQLGKDFQEVAAAKLAIEQQYRAYLKAAEASRAAAKNPPPPVGFGNR